MILGQVTLAPSQPCIGCWKTYSFNLLGRHPSYSSSGFGSTRLCQRRVRINGQIRTITGIRERRREATTDSQLKANTQRLTVSIVL